MSKTILCHCNVITEDMFLKAIEENKERIADMPLNKAAGFVLNQVREELNACDEQRPDGSVGRRCPAPCLSGLQIMINEMESDTTAPQKGYETRRGCAVGDAIAGLLLEMK